MSVTWWFVWCLTFIVSLFVFSSFHGLGDMSFRFQHGASLMLNYRFFAIQAKRRGGGVCLYINTKWCTN